MDMIELLIKLCGLKVSKTLVNKHIFWVLELGENVKILPSVGRMQTKSDFPTNDKHSEIYYIIVLFYFDFVTALFPAY